MNTDRTDLPGAGAHAFETFVRVRHHEVDSLGHVNNAAYLNYIEQAAIDHAEYLGLDMDASRAFGGVFVARRHTILFVRPAFSGDQLRVVTWLGKPAGARVERSYLIFRETEPTREIPYAGRAAEVPSDEFAATRLVCNATTEWVFVNEAGQPRRIPPKMVTMFDPSANGQPDRHD